MIIKEKFNELIEISKKYDLLMLVLFGSYSKNMQNKNSDVDLAFLSKENFDEKKYFNLRNEILDVLIINKLDLIDLKKTCDLLIKKEIFKEGICIYEEKGGLFDDYAITSYMSYLDFKEYYKYRDEIIKLRLARLKT